MPIKVAVDVGGTFTDVCVMDDGDGQIRLAKVPSTTDPIEAVLAGVARAGVNLSDVALFCHGTTAATNALITRSLDRAAMITTRGFRDVIEIRRGTKDDLWDVYKDVAPPYIRRRDRLVVNERVDYSGRVVQPLDEDEARHAAQILRRRGISTVAVCFVNAFANSEHELRMRDILKEEMPGVAVSTSAEVLPEIFEHERFSTTVVNAALSPLIARYVRRLEGALTAGGYRGDLLLLHSGGGVMTPKVAERFAARLAGSGIAAGALASRYIASLCGFENAIGIDMGGTSTDISVIYESDIHVTREWYVEFGYPICFPTIDVRTLGAGGGSIAWIDDAGSLRSGPQSAGAIPGPACYGLGTEEPTTTDANLVLGRLGLTLVGGEMHLDRAEAERAVQTVASSLGLDLFEGANAIVQVANANVADGVRLVSIRRGYDPRDFALVVFGGAGPLHGAALAQELSIPTVVIPPNPGITSALGCLLVDVRHDLSAPFFVRIDEIDADEVEDRFRALEEEGRELLRTEGVGAGEMMFQRSIDMKYVGQWRSIAVPAESPIRVLENVVHAFHALHDREHNYRRADTPLEVFRLNLTALGVTLQLELPSRPLRKGVAKPVEGRLVRFEEAGKPIDTPVYRREGLEAGARLHGPAVIEQLDSTVLVPPGVSAEVDEWLNIRLHLAGAA